MTLLENRWFRVEQTENPDVRIYGSRLPLLPEGWGVQGLIKGQQSRDDLPFEVAPVLKLVADVPGVAQAEVRAYQIVVIKSPVFSWEEIDLHMLPLMRGVVSACEMEHHEAPRSKLNPFAS